jgi:hypothetical protein
MTLGKLTSPSKTKKQQNSAIKKKSYYREKYPYMAELWYPTAIRDPMRDSGGFLSDYQWRGVLHTTEGSTYAGARAAYLAGKAPHFTVSFERGAFQVWQHIPLNKSARALAHPRDTVETNRARCIQIEIVASAARAGALQCEYLDGIGRLMRWIESNTGISRSALDFKGDDEGIVLARDTSPIRLNPTAWKNFNGWCGHQHVPYNSHWDPGDIDIDYLMSVDVGVRPVIDPPLNIEIVDARRDIYTDGFYLLGQDGAIFAFGGAVYYKGVNGQDFFRNSTAARLLFPDEANALSPAPAGWKNYKYVVQSTEGALYGCPW